MSDLRKIITDGKNKFKAFEEADKALKELDALTQAVKDNTKVVELLHKERDTLNAENAATKGKIADAEAKAADILSKAQAQATAAIEAAQDTIAVNQAKADKKLMETNDRIRTAERKAIVAEGQAKEAADKLAAINAELDAAKARAQKLLGA